MDITDQQKIEQSQQAINAFVKQFGENDIIKEAFFDVLLEAIYDTGNNISLPSKTEQDRDQNTDNSRESKMPTYEIE